MIDRRDEQIAQLQAVVAAQQEQIALLTAEVTRLRAEVASLREQLGRSSLNSSKQPSSDAPADRAARAKREPSGRKRGGQPGHGGHQRVLLPPEKVTRRRECFPRRCRSCDVRLPHLADPEPLRHQVVELPEVAPDVTEYRLHRVTCACGEVTCAQLPKGVPRGMCGPRLSALIALLTGNYHLSRREAATLLADVLGIDISVGALSEVEERVSEVLAAAVDEALEHARRARVKHVDATGWRQSGATRTLWTIATALVTVFAVTADATGATVRALVGALGGFLVSDRAGQFGYWAMNKRQVCWAHLVRKFVAFSQSAHPDAARIGEGLLLFAQGLLHEWHRVRDGTLTRTAFRKNTRLSRTCIENLLARGQSLGLRGVSGACKDILAHREALWTFIDVRGIEPTNNHAERELRGFVLWRKTSGGAQSERGSRFAERIMTVVHTLRKQHRPVLAHLTNAYKAALRGQQTASLLPLNP